MFTISPKKRLFRIFVLVFIPLILIVTGLFLVKKDNTDVNATSDGGTVTVTPGGTIYYDGWETNHFYISSNGSNYDAFCAQPSLGTPVGNYTANLITDGSNAFKQLKLMIYITTVDNSYTRAAEREMFDYWGATAEEEYAWAHAIMGAIYGGDYTGVSPGNVEYINRMIGILQGYIDNQSPVWILAKNYKLFRTLGGGYVQDIVWIEGNSQVGSISVQKCDKTTNACIPQGNANFSGITFALYNNSGEKIYVPGKDAFYNNGDLIATATTDANGQVTFSGLAAYNTSYIVKETATNSSYELTAGQQTTTLNGNGSSQSLKFYDNVKTGSINVNKIDAETNSCTTVGNLSFDGTTFQLINNSTNSISYNGTIYAKNAVVDTKTLSNGSCSVKFENLPYGSYIVKETSTGTGYVLNTTPQTVSLPVSSTSTDATITFKNQAIRGDVKFVKMDEANNKPMRDVLFSISAVDENYQIGETHIVVSDENGVVDTSASFALHSFHTNGYDALYDEPDPIFFSAYGSWFGYDHTGNPLPVNDTLGALPYGKYIIQELKCGSNLFCYGIKDQKTTITINTANQVVDLGDWNNTCAKFSLETEATDETDGDKFLEVGTTKATIKDTISYCVKPGLDFTIKGVLMDKETGEKLLINGEPLEATVTINSEEECGETEMYFDLDITKLGGKEIVVFESLYYKDDLIVAHEDINDVAQTVEVVELYTYATNRDTNDKMLPYDEDVVIRDVVKYCLKSGVEYTVKGILMDRVNKEALTINDETIEQEVTFIPEEKCGEVEMFYSLNTTDLQGAKFVIFESLYRDGEPIISHEDFDNEDESVEVTIPAPETGSYTSNSGDKAKNYYLVFPGILIVATFVSFGIARKKRSVSFKKW